MHPNQIFHDADARKNLDFAREIGFGMLAINSDGAPLLSHVPFLLDEAGSEVLLHLVRSNPIARAARSPVLAKIAVAGPDGYVSPDWYGVPDQVPTWNYVAVHLSGTLEVMPQEEMRAVLDAQSAHYEGKLAPKQPWHADKMTPEVLDRMMRQIVPCRMKITGVDGTWKLSQNKPDDVRLSAADHMAMQGIGTDARVLAALMRGVGEE